MASHWIQRPLGGVFEQARNMALPVSLKTQRERLEDRTKKLFKISCESSTPTASETSSEQRGAFPRIEGASALLWDRFLQKLQREGTEAHTHAHSHIPSSAEVGPGSLLEKDASDCHLPFLLFVDYQTLSAVSRAAVRGRGWGGRMKRGRKGGNPSLCRNRARVF